MSIVGIIRDIMQNERITQIELAQRLSISKQAVSQMLNQDDMRISTVIAMLDALGYSFKIVRNGK